MDLEPFERSIKECFPDLRIRRLKQLSGGWDSLALEVNDAIIFKFPKRPEVEAQLRTETRLLPVLAGHLPVRVPDFEMICEGELESEVRFVGYPKIDGEFMNGTILSGDRGGSLAPHLSRFLSQLHGFPLRRAAECGLPLASPAEWQQEFRNLYRTIRERVLPLLGASRQHTTTALWEGFLSSEDNFRFQSMLIHRDLGAKHILCDPVKGLINGIIDWGGASIGDSAFDFACLLREYGANAIGMIRDSYACDVDSTFDRRVAFYAKILPFYEVLYGIAHFDKTHVEHGLEMLDF